VSAEGIFHDAHEVYTRQVGSLIWKWTATFATRDLALNYGVFINDAYIDRLFRYEWELRPV